MLLVVLIVLMGVRVVHVVKLHKFAFFVPYCEVRFNFRVKTMFGYSLPPFVLYGVYVLSVFICIYLSILVLNVTSPTQKMFLSFNSYTTGVSSGAEMWRGETVNGIRVLSS